MLRSVERKTLPPKRRVRHRAPFENGDRMDQPTFHALYKQTPPDFKAELIGGVVYMPSPTSPRHGRPHFRVALWLGLYVDATDGTDGFDNTTNILGPESEPQPDLCLIVCPECGGQTGQDEEGYLSGPPELVVEVAYSSANIDLHAKRDVYEAAGVREYMVVLADPEGVARFVRRGNRFVEKGPDEDGLIRSAVFPGLWLNPSGLFARSTRALTATLHKGLAIPEHTAFVAKLESKRAALARRKPKT